jgi:hypothetical protein
MRNHLVAIVTIFLLGCSAKIPMNQDDICVIIDENPRWSNSLLDAKKKWNAEPSTVMAIIRQESSFNANAAPDREKVLGFIPWKRPSSARGYSQAVEATWEQYKEETGNKRARRSSFDSSVDFIGWYLSKASSARIRSYEVDKLYIAYHEGYGGYKRKSFKNKSWLQDIAKKVKYNSVRYQRQLKSCPLQRESSFFDIF